MTTVSLDSPIPAAAPVGAPAARATSGLPTPAAGPTRVYVAKPDLEVLARWATRVGSLTADLPQEHQANPDAAGYVELTAWTTMPSVAQPPAQRWVAATEVGAAMQLAQNLEYNPARFRTPTHLPASSTIWLTKYADKVGKTLKSLGYANDANAVRGGFFCIREPQNPAVFKEPGSLWVHADDLAAAVDKAKEIHGAGSINDKLRLEAKHLGEERRAQAIEKLLSVDMRCAPGGVTPEQREMVHDSLRHLKAEQLAPNAPLDGAWKPETVIASYLRGFVRDPAVFNAWSAAYATDPAEGRPPIADRVIIGYLGIGLNTLARVGLGEQRASTMHEAMLMLGNIFRALDTSLPATPFAAVGVQLLGQDSPDSFYGALWPRLLSTAPDIPAGKLRDQAIACAQNVAQLHGVIREIDATVLAEHPGFPLASADTVTEAVELVIATRADPTIAEIAGAISWCHGRDLPPSPAA